MTEPIIVYAAASQRRLSKQLRELSTELTCCCCKQAVMVVTKTFAQTLRLADRTGRKVAVVCPACFDTTPEDDYLLLHLPDTEYRKLLEQSEAERN